MKFSYIPPFLLSFKSSFSLYFKGGWVLDAGFLFFHRASLLFLWAEDSLVKFENRDLDDGMQENFSSCDNPMSL